MLVWLLPVALIVPNIGLDITEYNSVWAKIANTTLPLGIYMLLAGLSTKIGRTILLFIPLMVLCAFQIVLLYLYGENIIAIDMFMNVVTTNATEVGELLGNLKIAILTVVVIYLPLIIAGICVCRKHKRATQQTLAKSRKWGKILIALGVLAVVCAYLFAPCYKIRRELFPYNVIENMCTAVARSVESANYPETSAHFKYDASTMRPDSLKEVYVLVIGETSRADNWQLYGYGRPTNPKLSKRANLVFFPKTLSEINTTHKSVPMLLSPLTAKTFGDSVSHTRSILAAFNESGYATAFISNQRRNHSYIDYYGEEASTAVFLAEKDTPGSDMDLVAELKEFITGTKANKIFVVLHSYGSHFEYNKRYPSAEAVFKPDKNAEASSLNRGQLMNAYDNTIVYTDFMLDSVASTLESLNLPAAMLYVSDHGEDIFDDKRNRFLHASPVPTYWQLHVPLFVWMTNEYRKSFPEKFANLRANSQRNVSSSASVFHTVVELAGLKTPWLDPQLSLSSEKFATPQRLYLNDYNESIDLKESGLHEPDFVQLDKNAIEY